jgi:hypothetical protein
MDEMTADDVYITSRQDSGAARRPVPFRFEQKLLLWPTAHSSKKLKDPGYLYIDQSF